MHLAGMIHRQGLPLKTMHLAEVLAREIVVAVLYAGPAVHVVQGGATSLDD